MSGSGYDQSVTTFSPEGRIYQVEYALKAVEIAETVVGVKCRDGILLAGEKQRFSRLLVDNANKRIYNIDATTGFAICGKLPDGRAILQRAKQESQEYLKNFAVPLSGNILADRVALFVHYFTLNGSTRPFGSSVFIASHNEFDGFQLHMIEPSGHSYAYHACAHGKGRSICKSEFERKNFKDLTCKEALPLIAKMLILSHEEFKDKKFEYEMSWITEHTNFKHQAVPQDLINHAVEEAEALIEKDQLYQFQKLTQFIL